MLIYTTVKEFFEVDFGVQVVSGENYKDYIIRYDDFGCLSSRLESICFKIGDEIFCAALNFVFWMDEKKVSFSLCGCRQENGVEKVDLCNVFLLQVFKDGLNDLLLEVSLP